MRRLLLLAVCLPISLLLLACAPSNAPATPIVGSSVTGATLERADGGRLPLFGLDVEKDGDPVGLDFRGSIDEGSVRVVILDEKGATAWWVSAGSGPFAINTTIRELPAGPYKIALEWPGPIRIHYSLTWKPGGVPAPTITPVALLSGLGMLAVGIGFVAYALRRRLGGRYLALGAAAWVVSVALKFAWAIPVNPPLYTALLSALPEPLAVGLFCLYVGSLTGVFEVAVVYLVLRRTRFGRASYRQAVAFGIGFGAVEAIVVSLSPLVMALAALTSPSLLPPGTLESLAASNDLLYALAPVWERFFVVLVHLGSGVLIYAAIASRRPRLLWTAFVLKTLLDTPGAYGQLVPLTTPVGPVSLLFAIEAVMGVCGVIALWLTRRAEASFEESATGLAPWPPSPRGQGESPLPLGEG